VQPPPGAAVPTVGLTLPIRSGPLRRFRFCAIQTSEEFFVTTIRLIVNRIHGLKGLPRLERQWLPAAKTAAPVDSAAVALRCDPAGVFALRP
jgi:hypothetical protein